MKSINLLVLTSALLTLFTSCKKQINEITFDSEKLKLITEINSDVQLEVKDGVNSEAQGNDNISKSFDGNLNSLYHSKWSGATFPVTLQYNFEAPQTVDYILYYPRSDGNINGNFGEFDLYYSTADSTDVKVGSYDFKFSGTATSIYFNSSLNNVKSFKFMVKSGGNNFVSVAEMKFFQRASNSTEYLSLLFKDDVYSQLHDYIKQADIDKVSDSLFRNVAQQLFDKKYSKYRLQNYEAYRDVQDLVKEMKTSSYNSWENPTGIYFNAGDEITLVVGDYTEGTLKFKTRDFVDNGQFNHPIQKGINKFKVDSKGLGYIEFYSDNYKTTLPVKIHILSGKVNGYFDLQANTSNWKQALDSTVTDYYDIKGKYANHAYRVVDLKAYANDLPKWTETMDKFVYLQYEVMGLVKYNKVPKNHMFSRSVTSGWYANWEGANFDFGAMKNLLNTDGMLLESWGIAHEFGHVNQIRPGLRWVGTTETTNNVFSSLTNFKYNKANLRLEGENIGDDKGNHMIGGRFNAFLNSAIVNKQLWLQQRGPDYSNETYVPEGNADHFVKVIPLYQLMLYYREADKAPWRNQDWYGIVAEKVRNTDESAMSNGELQINFVRNVCIATNENLTDFFEKIGMLKAVDVQMEDYSSAPLRITQAQVDAVKKEFAGYKAPASPVIYYLSANSLDAFNNRLPVQGTFNSGVTNTNNGFVTINHSVWKNVTVFETYAGNTLTKIAMVGSNAKDAAKSTTQAYYPEGSTRIEAVAWDGTRTLVYGKR